MGSKKSPQQELEQYSRNRFGMIFSDWIVNSHDEEDFGFDFEVRPTKRRESGFYEVSPQNFYVQLKASEDFENPEVVSVDLSVQKVLEWLDASVPVVLAIYERESDEFYWCIVQDYSWDILDMENPGWREQKSVTYSVERMMGNNLDMRPNLTASLSLTQERIAFRQHVSALGGPSRESWTFEVDSATADEVNQYKLGKVETARKLMDNGHTSKALTELIEVYRMPEDDEGKLEAIISLLEGRDVDHPVIAVAQNRFGHEGIEIAEAIGRTEVIPDLRELVDDRRESMRTHFVGAKFYDNEVERSLTILNVENFVPFGGRPMWIALVQYESGRYVDESAEAVCPPRFELTQPGNGENPLGDSCDENEHSFAEENVDELGPQATCGKCGLSVEVLRDVMNHDLFRSIGGKCWDCEVDLSPSTPKSDYHFDVDGRRICSSCWVDYDERFGVKSERIGEVFEIFCLDCLDWTSDQVPDRDVCPDCGTEGLMIRGKQAK